MGRLILAAGAAGEVPQQPRVGRVDPVDLLTAIALIQRDSHTGAAAVDHAPNRTSAGPRGEHSDRVVGLGHAAYFPTGAAFRADFKTNHGPMITAYRNIGLAATFDPDPRR